MRNKVHASEIAMEPETNFSILLGESIHVYIYIYKQIYIYINKYICIYNICIYNICIYNICIYNICIYNICIYNICIYNMYIYILYIYILYIYIIYILNIHIYIYIRVADEITHYWQWTGQKWLVSFRLVCTSMLCVKIGYR